MAGPDSASGSVDDILAHYGIKGMRWGVRRTQKQIDAAESSSDDKKATQATAAKIKSSGTRSLSNKELRDYLERMDLERRYNASRPPSAKDEAKKFVKDTLINIGKQEAGKYAAKQVAKALAGR